MGRIGLFQGSWEKVCLAGVCVCVCAGFTLSAEAAQHFGMLLACTEGISGQGEGFLSHKHS